MNKLEIQFFDEYKAVDKLCGLFLDSDRGVSDYIKEMERLQDQGRKLIPNWDGKYKKLKHLRWVRNQIAHDEAAEIYDNDLIELQHFHKQLLHAKDPVNSLVGRARRVNPRKVAKEEALKKKLNPVAIVIIIIVVMLIIFYIKKDTNF